MLKGRFPGLKELGGTQDMQELYNAVEATMVLHNICIGLDNHPEDIFDYDPSDDTGPETLKEEDDGDLAAEIHGQAILQRVQLPGQETDAWLRVQGVHKRLRFLDELCPVEEF